LALLLAKHLSLSHHGMAFIALAVTASASVGFVMGDGTSKPKPVSAEWRRWEGNTECKGAYIVIDNDSMEFCQPKLIPALASLKIEQTNDTMYSNYHYQGVTDCSGDTRTHVEDFSVGVCDSFKEGNYSQMRVWVYAKDITLTESAAVDVGDGSSKPKPVSADMRRWEGSTECKGQYTVIDNDLMDTCQPKLIPALASLKIEQTNDTMYSNYHYQGVTDCSGETRTHVMDFVVGVCEGFKEGNYSQMRVWVYPGAATVIV
jgi:hypothetical protein